jgi:predicted nucleotidyltransferase
MNPLQDIPTAAIKAFCARWKVCELALFGSALRDDFGPDSDIDLLVTFDAGFRPGLRDLMAMEEELKVIFGREIDLIERSAVEQSENYIRRRAILGNLETLYRAA